ncbi:unnamed protein product [Rotaria sp. Silwood1]|nr:unnamed protein product [Rotaria sp. Silwood1]
MVLCQPKNADCVAQGGPIKDCFQIISSNCDNATFVADRLAYTDRCSAISLFWDAPTYNMTILFQSYLTKPYELCIRRVACTQAFRTLEDGREVPVEWKASGNEPTCFKTERDDFPTMKFRFDAGKVWHCYGTFINFFYRF